MSSPVVTTPVDLWRRGNATSPRLDNIRSQDVDTEKRGNIEFVLANGKGISCFDSRDSGTNWWKLPAGSLVVAGLTLINDNNPPGHWVFAPAQDMPLDEYRGLLTVQGAPASWQRFRTLVPAVPDSLDTFATPAAGGTPMALSAKAHSFVIDAIDQHIARLEARLAQIDDSPSDEDEAADLGNDLLLYKLIVRHLKGQSPTGR